jgi:hypothetical protein
MSYPYIFISYSREDYHFVEKLSNTLRSKGIQIWLDRENITAGTNWQKAIEKGLLGATSIIYVASKHSASSQWMNMELGTFLQANKLIIPIILDDAGAQNLPYPLQPIQWVDFRSDYENGLLKLVNGIGLPQQSPKIERPKLKSKGYVFISYADEDKSFVADLKVFLGKHDYAYWEFEESSRDYHVDYSLELEGVIRGAACTLSVISPNWKQSEVSMKEFHFSKEVRTPVFILKVDDPGPTLALSGLTPIDFTHDRDKGFASLDKALKSKRL